MSWRVYGSSLLFNCIIALDFYIFFCFNETCFLMRMAWEKNPFKRSKLIQIVRKKVFCNISLLQKWILQRLEKDFKAKRLKTLKSFEIVYKSLFSHIPSLLKVSVSTASHKILCYFITRAMPSDTFAFPLSVFFLFILNWVKKRQKMLLSITSIYVACVNNPEHVFIARCSTRNCVEPLILTFNVKASFIIFGHLYVHAFVFLS